ncbi:MAG: hypothetical protein ACRCXT_00175 [Paraclostridium sp.]
MSYNNNNFNQKPNFNNGCDFNMGQNPWPNYQQEFEQMCEQNNDQGCECSCSPEQPYPHHPQYNHHCQPHYSQQNSHCQPHHHGCKPNGGLEYFHETIKRGACDYQEANDHLIQAIKAIEIAMYLLQESEEYSGCGDNSMKEAFEWLNKFGCQFNCNYNSPQCKRIEEKAMNVFAKAEQDEKEAAKLIKCALDKLMSAKKDYAEGRCLTDELVKCVHGKC